MVSTVTQLSANAKMNLRHEDCWQVFTSIIKPQIEQLLSSYFIDWQLIEEHVTAMVMKHKGLFATRQIITRIDDTANAVDGLTDVKEFRKIKRLGFRPKICYLLKNELVADNVLELPYTLSKRRNKIHEYAEVLTDDDRALFNLGFRLLHAFYTARCLDAETENMEFQMEQNEKEAIKYLKLIHAQEASRFQGSIFVDIDLDRVKGGWELPDH